MDRGLSFLVQGRVLARVLEGEGGRELGGRFGTLLDRHLMSVAVVIRGRKGGRKAWRVVWVCGFVWGRCEYVKVSGRWRMGDRIQHDRAMALPRLGFSIMHNGRVQPDPDHEFVSSSLLLPKQQGLGAERCSRSRPNSLSICSPTAHIGESWLEKGQAAPLATRCSSPNQRWDDQSRLTRWVTFAQRGMGISTFDRISERVPESPTSWIECDALLL